RYACYDTYVCADGGWVAVGAIEGHFYKNLCTLLGCEWWADHQLDDAVQDQVRADFAAAFATKPRDEWVAILAPADTCVSAVLSIPEVIADPQVVARGSIAEAHHPTAGDFRQLGTLLAGTDTARRSFDLRDGAATDTEALLTAAGYAADDIARLRDEGVVA
ncbi:MAG: CoA transferase, partial [Acidimicrobiales bacterium]|nr:CoA transferase [Acidimicrobiales bacterium]